MHKTIRETRDEFGWRMRLEITVVILSLFWVFIVENAIFSYKVFRKTISSPSYWMRKKSLKTHKKDEKWTYAQSTSCHITTHTIRSEFPNKHEQHMCISQKYAIFRLQKNDTMFLSSPFLIPCFSKTEQNKQTE